MDWSANVLSYFASVTARSLILFVVAAVVLLAFRVRSSAANHAVWTVVAGGMLLLAALSPALPPVPLHVLKAQGSVAAVPELPASSFTGQVANVTDVVAPARQSTWRD